MEPQIMEPQSSNSDRRAHANPEIAALNNAAIKSQLSRSLLGSLWVDHPSIPPLLLL